MCLLKKISNGLEYNDFKKEKTPKIHRSIMQATSVA